MKLFLAITAMVVLIASTAHAGGFEDNPDRYTSIGISFGGSRGSGDFTLKSAGFRASQDADVTGYGAGVDLRIPVSNSFTLMTSASVSSREDDFTETLVIIGAESDITIFEFRIGARFYFNQ